LDAKEVASKNENRAERGAHGKRQVHVVNDGRMASGNAWTNDLNPCSDLSLAVVKISEGGV